MQVMIHNEAGIGIPLFLASLDGHTAEAQGPDADSARRPDGLQLRRARLARRLNSSQAQGIAAMNTIVVKLLAQRIAIGGAVAAGGVGGRVRDHRACCRATPRRSSSARKRRPRRWPRCAPDGARRAGASALRALARRPAAWRPRHLVAATQLPVAELIGSRLPNSLLLAAVTALFAVPLALALRHRGSGVARFLVRPLRIDRRGGDRLGARIPGRHARRLDLRGAAALAAGAVLRRAISNRSVSCCAPSRCRCVTLTCVDRRADDAHDPRRGDRPARGALHRDGAAQGRLAARGWCSRMRCPTRSARSPTRWR